MKFFHLSDLHIGLKLINRDLQEDQKHILRQIVSCAEEERPDAVVIAGDVYDRSVPSAEAVELFDAFVTDLSRTLPDAEIMIISGNHDSAQRVNQFRHLLSRQHLHLIGMPPMLPDESIEKVTLRDAYGEVNFYLLPFVKPSMVRRIVGTDDHGNSLSYEESVRRLLERENIDESVRNVLVSHQFYIPSGSQPKEIERMDSEILQIGNIDAISAAMLQTFDYAALGHIHRAMRVGSEVLRYSGTPLACSVSEHDQQKSVLSVELGRKGDVKITELPLKPLRQVRIMKGSLEQILEHPSEDYVTVILTDVRDLDVTDMQDRLRAAFPFLLEIRREGLRHAEFETEAEESEAQSPLELCRAFFPQMNDEEMQLIQDVLNKVTEEE